MAAGGSFTFGSMSGSGYASISQDKIKSNYDSVREQSGIYAGKDGFDVTVGNHTQLNGAVIASTATDDKNSINTNTLGWSDIHNQADYKASHTGISLSGGSGMSASQMVASNAIAGAANALTGMSGSSGHAEGTTSSAISGGNLIIRNKESQKQDIAGLSRDPENANGSIAPIFDKEKEQKRLQEAQVISQISGQMSNIVMTYGETEAMKEARAKHPGLSDAQLRETPEYREVMTGYGTGSTPQMVVQAITGVLGGLNAGNPGQALAGGLNPAVAQLIKQATGDNREANLMAHAVWGALAAQLSGNNAASGAVGAFSGELAARYIIDNYYGGRTDNLSEQERQQISMLATIASGIAGGLAGNSTASAGTGALAGKNAVENNSLSGWENLPKGLTDVINSQGSLGGSMIQTGASPDEITAALVKNAQGQTPEGQDPVKGLLSAWGNFFGVPLDVVLSNEQMTPQKAAEIISSGVPTSEAKLMQYVAAKAFFTVAKSTDLGLSASNQKYVDILSPEAKQHILFGDSPTSGGHLYPGNPGKTVYPKDWSADKVVHEIGDIATSPDTKWFALTGTGGMYTAKGDPAKWFAYEVRDGVRIRVVYQPATGKIVTAFPDNKPVPPASKPIKK
nr:VENN motif pre-toxin domain-containing protein [Escherichia coli]